MEKGKKSAEKDRQPTKNPACNLQERKTKRIKLVHDKTKLTPGNLGETHPVFHVSQLKQHIGPVVKQSALPILNDERPIAKEPVSILDRRLVNKQGKAVIEVPVTWKNCFPEEST